MKESDERSTSASMSTRVDFIVKCGLSDGKVAAVSGPPFLV